MTSDLKKRVNEAQSFLDYAQGKDACEDNHATRVDEVKRSTTKMLMFIQDLIECVHEQQAEINRLNDYEANVKKLMEMCSEAEEEKHCNQMAYYRWAYLDKHIKIIKGETK